MLVSFEQVYKSFNGVYLLENISFTLEEKDRVGIIGPNGAGKTTLLRLLQGKIDPDKGEIRKAKNITVGVLDQIQPADPNNSISDEMMLAFAPLLAQQKEMLALEGSLSGLDPQSKEAEEALARYAMLQSDFETHDGHLMEVNMAKVLNGLGFPKERWQDPVSALSGGEKTRLALARLLLQAPDLLILDEPTNHLDFDTLHWLESFLVDYRGAVLAVSHDRFFLDAVASRIFEVENRRLTAYKGNYTAYLGLREAAYERQEKEYKAQQQKIAELTDFVARNMVRASTSALAKSRQKELDRMERIEKPIPPAKAANFSFEPRIQSGKEVLEIADLGICVGEEKRRLFSGFNLSLRLHDRVAIIGPNGVGKTSLFRVLMGLMSPAEGKLRWGVNVYKSYFEQEGKNLNPENTVMEEFWQHDPRLSPFEVRSALGRVRISGEAVEKRVSMLSGGEKARLEFAIMHQERGNLLLLDEPTNHLDLPTKESLEEALQEFDGTVLLISHDRYFLRKIPNKIVELRENGYRIYPGNYDDYLEAKRREAELMPASLASQPQRQSAPKQAQRNSKEMRVKTAKWRAEKLQLEEELAYLEQEEQTLRAEIEDPEIYKDYLEMGTRCTRLDQIAAESEEKMCRLVEIEALLEEAAGQN